MATKQPLVSIITCVKDNYAFLPQCLASIASQDYPNVEHIIIEGHSQDGSLSLIKKYQRQYPNRQIKLYIHPPHGIANALNYGISRASGKYIHIVHADDYYCSKDSVKRAVSILRKNPQSKWIVGNHLLDLGGKVITLHNNFFTKTFGKSLIWLVPWMSHQNMFYDIDLYKNGGMYNESYSNSLDYDQWLRLIKDHPIMVVDENFSVFRIHKNSTTFNPKNLSRLLTENAKAVATNIFQ